MTAALLDPGWPSGLPDSRWCVRHRRAAVGECAAGGVMGAITLLAVVSRRRRQAIPVLSACVIVLMIASPELAVDVGFALSVSATRRLWWSRPSGRGAWSGVAGPSAGRCGQCRGRAQLVTARWCRHIGHFSVVSSSPTSRSGRDPADHRRRHRGRRAVSALASGYAAVDPVHRPGIVVAAARRAVGRGCSGCFR